MMEVESTDVLIVGAGPTGTLLSAYLGRAGVRNIILERDPDITTDPRGIALDEEGIRYMQGLGLYKRIYTEVGVCFGKLKFISGTELDLHKRPIYVIDCSTSEGGTGHTGAMSHKQPTVEKLLRESSAATKFSELRSQSTAREVREEPDGVVVVYTDASGILHTIKSKFLVGADGAKGFVRKHFLEGKGVRMEKADKWGYQETWVALNWKMTLPTPETHPDFPLWDKGYTPEDVWDLFFPPDFRFICNPKRPAVCGRFGQPEDRLWRFEFVVLQGEDGWKMADQESLKKVVYPYITHPGSRYGLPGEIQFPDDCIECLRSRPFNFAARSCNRWAVGRVMLVGDAAHVFPPFGGQGITSGWRDAVALAWRLQIACHERYCGNYNVLFTAWYLERKQQLERSIKNTVANGAACTETNPYKIFLRDWALWFLQLIPSVKRTIEKGPRAGSLTKLKYQDGTDMPFLPDIGGGATFPQVYCRRLALPGSTQRMDDVTFTDDVIYHKSKRGFMQLVVLLKSANEISDAKADLQDADTISGGNVLSSEAVFFIDDLNAVLETSWSSESSENIYRIASGEEFARDPILCRNRPSPIYYDEHRMMKDMKSARYIILRPDRFVFAACHDKQELKVALQRLPGILGLSLAKS